MSSFVKEYVRIEDHTSLDDAIEALMELRRSMPEGANAELRMRGDDVFGPNFGGATVFTNVRKGYLEECPNVGKLLQNLAFTLPMESKVMGGILDDGLEPADAATAWLKANPASLDSWLAGVTTFDGGDGLAAVKAHLGL